MSTEEKKLTSSEIDEMLKEMEEYHQPIRTKNNNRKKRPKIRIDMIIAGVVILALVVGAVALIFHFTQKSSHSTSKSVKENPLMDEKYPEITDVVKNYYNAKLIEDSQKRLSVLAQYVDNMGDMTEKDIAQIDYVQSYSNFECYTKDGPYENTYVVYAYYEMELKNTSTSVPSVDRLYVIRDSKTGNVYIHNGVSNDVKEYMDTVTKDQDVQDLLKEVKQELEDVLNSDERLKNVFAKMGVTTETETTTALTEQNTQPVTTVAETKKE